MDWTNLLNTLVPALGQAGVDALSGKLADLASGQDEEWKKSTLALLGNAIEKHGPQGLQLGLDAINAMLNDEAPDIDWADLEVASDILAQLQNAEADRRSAARAYLVQVGEVLGDLMSGIIKGLIASA